MYGSLAAAKNFSRWMERPTRSRRIIASLLTKNILLEAAYFLPASIRRTARNLNLPTDASYRFERGVDPEMVLRASQRATELIRQIAGGTPATEINAAGKLPTNPADVSLSYEKCDRVVGISIKRRTVDEILEGFGLKQTNSERIRKKIGR